MSKQPTDYLEAFRQLWLLLTIVCWVGFVYFLITGDSSTMLQVSRHGQVGIGTANVFSALIISLFSTLMLIFLVIPSKTKKKEKK